MAAAPAATPTTLGLFGGCSCRSARCLLQPSTLRQAEIRLSPATLVHAERSSWASRGACFVLALVSASLRRRTAQAATAKGGVPATVLRKQKRIRQEKREMRKNAKVSRFQDRLEAPFRIDKNKPPSNQARGMPKSGAWSEGKPKSESSRQGQYRSPWTQQVYDRWTPDGSKQKQTDRQGGLARARAYETPTQRQLSEALAEQDQEEKVPEWKKFMPGLVPDHVLPKQMRNPNQERIFDRHAYRAGNFSDIFKQIVVQTVVDLKVKKSDTPIWYVEPCAGEGEYSVQRMRSPDDGRPPLKWPQAEDLYAVLEDQDLTYMPLEVKGWMDTMKMLNRIDNGFEVKGGIENLDPAEDGPQWLPSTLLMAARHLRKQDPVTCWEDNRVAFTALVNFCRNWSHSLEPHIELVFKDGLKHCKRRWMERRPGSRSEVFGLPAGQRGIVFIDPDYSRGSEGERAKTLIVGLHKHWRAATVVVTYPIGPSYEKKARKFNQEVKEKDPSLDLLSIEAYVENEGWTEGSREAKWRGCGVLISSPQFQTGERVEAAMKVIADCLGTMEGATPIHVRVEQIK